MTLAKLLGSTTMALLAASAVACGSADNGPAEQQTTGEAAQTNAQATGYYFICMPAYMSIWGYGRCSAEQEKVVTSSPEWHESQPGVWSPKSAACDLSDPNPLTAGCCSVTGCPTCYNP